MQSALVVQMMLERKECIQRGRRSHGCVKQQLSQQSSQQQPIQQQIAPKQFVQQQHCSCFMYRPYK